MPFNQALLSPVRFSQCPLDRKDIDRKIISDKFLVKSIVLTVVATNISTHVALQYIKLFLFQLHLLATSNCKNG